MFEFWCVKIENCMWNVWNLKCLNWDMWILKSWKFLTFSNFSLSMPILTDFLSFIPSSPRWLLCPMPHFKLPCHCILWMFPIFLHVTIWWQCLYFLACWVQTSLVWRRESFQHLQMVIKTYNVQLLKVKNHPNMKNYIHVKIFILWTLVISTLINEWEKILSPSPNLAQMHGLFLMGIGI